MKCALVIDQDLPIGLIANTAAVLSASIGRQSGDLIGEDVFDADCTRHPGITQLPILILKGSPDSIRALRARAAAMSDPSFYYVDFCDIAQHAKIYGDYQTTLSTCTTDSLVYLGLGLYGPPRLVKSLTGNLPLLR